MVRKLIEILDECPSDWTPIRESYQKTLPNGVTVIINENVLSFVSFKTPIHVNKSFYVKYLPEELRQYITTEYERLKEIEKEKVETYQKQQTINALNDLIVFLTVPQ